jgi:hypothetical protein
MKASLLLCAIFVLMVGSNLDASARRLIKRVCVTEADTSISCTYYYDDGREVKRTDRRINGIPYKQYIRGLQRGECMPSPAGPGICGGE